MEGVVTNRNLLIAILVLLLLNFVHGVMLQTNDLLIIEAIKNDEERLNADKILSSSSVPSGQSDDVSDWKTYQNEKYGFEFMYPKDWSVEIVIDKYGSEDPPEPNPAGPLALYREVESIQVITDNSDQSYIKIYPNDEAYGVDERTGGKEMFFGGRKAFYKLRENHMMTVSVEDPPENWTAGVLNHIESKYIQDEEKIDRVLSTFKFIE